MIRSVLQLVAASCLLLGGAWLIGWWAVGLVLVAVGVVLAADAVLRDSTDPTVNRSGSVADVLERWRRER